MAETALAKATPQAIASTEHRFWEKVNVVRGGCWEWNARLNRKGYGEFRFKGRARLSHRVSWELKYGAITDDLCVLHRCDNPKCVNPDHLFIGTIADNNRDMYEKRRGFRGQHGPLGERNGAAKLTAEQVASIRGEQGSRRAVAKKYGVSASCIQLICSGKNWRQA